MSLTSIERDIQMVRLSELRWAAVALTVLLLTAVIGCSAEPEVVYVDREVIKEVPVEKIVVREVPVEVVVEKEVIREVVVTATPVPTAVVPRVIPTAPRRPPPLVDDYYVIFIPDSRSDGMTIRYFVDVPALNWYTAATGSASSGAPGHIADLLLDLLLKNGAITPGQKSSFSRGQELKIPLFDYAVAHYESLKRRGYRGLNDPRIADDSWEQMPFYYFDESMLESGTLTPSSYDSFDAASILARFSTSDPLEGEARSDAAGEIIVLYMTGNPVWDHVLDLIHTMAPDLSVDERLRAAEELDGISEDLRWEGSEATDGVDYLATLITRDDPSPGERIEAAHQMVALYHTGDLDTDQGLDLMNTIAPDLSINERRQAASALARLSPDRDWDDAERMAAASEVFRLVTGVPLDAEERIGTAVDLAGVGVKVFGQDGSFDEREIDAATEIITQSLTGELTSESLQSILGSGN